MKRIEQIDFWRGLMLVVMTVDHLQYMPFVRLSHYTLDFTYQTFGFVSAVEGFVLLSGLVFGLVYTPKLRADARQFRSAVRRRIGLIYLYHIGGFALVAALFSWHWFDAIWIHQWDAYSIAYLQIQPWLAALKGALFLYMPSFLDILPMYIGFLLLSLWVLPVLAQRRFQLIAIASIAIYVLAQVIQPLLLANTALNAAFPHQPAQFFLGWFDWFSWQVIFFAGMSLGVWRSQNPNAVLPVKRSGLIAALIVVVPLMWYRHQFAWPANPGITLANIDLVSDRSLGVLRLLNAVALAYLIYSLCKLRPNWFRASWICKLGQHSLLVFTFHIVLCYALNPLRNWLVNVPLWVEFLLLVAATALLYLPIGAKTLLNRAKQG